MPQSSWTWSSPLSSSDHCCLLTPLPWDCECRHREHTSHGLSEMGKDLPSLPWASLAWVYPLGNSVGGLIYLIQKPRVFLHWGDNLFQVTYPLRVGMAGCGRGEWLHHPNKVQKFSFCTGRANSQLSLNPHHFKHWVPPYFFNSRHKGLHQLKKNFLEGKINVSKGISAMTFMF